MALHVRVVLLIHLPAGTEDPDQARHPDPTCRPRSRVAAEGSACGSKPRPAEGPAIARLAGRGRLVGHLQRIDARLLDGPLMALFLVLLELLLALTLLGVRIELVGGVAR